MNEDQLSSKELEALRHIRNYFMHKGRSPSIRELMELLKYRSPRSVSVLIDRLVEKSILRRKQDGTLQLIKALDEDSSRAHTVDVPLVGSVACGMPVFAEENIEALLAVSTKLAKPPHKYFILKAKGDSMNKKDINDGDLVLVRQQQTAKLGQDVVALIDDEATIKEFHPSRNTIILRPASRNRVHTPIVLTNDFRIQGVVIKVISSR